MNRKNFLAIGAAGALMVALTGCQQNGGPAKKDGGGDAAPSANGAKVRLTGAGATFPYPLYSKWFAEYNKSNPGVEVNYQSVGSGAGIRQILENTVDFGASDAPMTDAELAKAKGELFHIPTTLGAVVVTYNVEGLEGLKLSSDAVAGIFLGEVKKWNDPAIAADNPGAKLPATPIVVANRSDGSGTTAVFTDYLAAVSPAWKEKVGQGKSVKWPVGVGAKGNEGVAGQVKQLNGSIGYVELAYAEQNGMKIAEVKNRAGNWVKPSPASVSAAAAGFADKMPEDMRVSIVDAPGAEAWPIAAFTYVLLYRDQPDATKGKAVVDMLWWAIHEGQEFNEPLSYAKLPASVVQKNEAKLGVIQHDGKPLRGGS